MSSAAVTPYRARPLGVPGTWIAFLMLMIVVGAALIAGAAPIAFSIATVFLFAGPHNWFEARYILGRLPARTGKLTGFFLLSFLGIITMTGLFASLPWWSEWTGGYITAVALWNTLLILWISTLVEMRSRQNPRHDWSLVWPIAFFLIAVTWVIPFIVSMALVYLHPLMALWILDRELVRSRPQWRADYHRCLMLVPIMAGILILHYWNYPELSADDELSVAIQNHAGANVFSGVSSHLLVALHTFLEMVHYGVWLIAIPLIGIAVKPWRIGNIPAARRSRLLRWGVALLLCLGVFITLVLWTCFVLDYSTTRYIYFTVALVHVLAEVPFLLRAL